MANGIKRRPENLTRVNIHEEEELTFWAERFGVSREQLKAAVAGSSPMLSAVATQLRIASKRATPS